MTIHFYGRVRGKCDGRLQNWPGIVNERPKFLAMDPPLHGLHAIMVQWSGKRALTLHSCIFVTDRVKINKLNTSIATGLLYAHTDFEAI